MTDAHEHRWSLLTARVARGIIDDDDDVAHTTFMLVVCADCATVTAFPPENFALTTPRYRDRLRAWLKQSRLTLLEE
jgi:hypothetical protein